MEKSYDYQFMLSDDSNRIRHLMQTKNIDKLDITLAIVETPQGI